MNVRIDKPIKKGERRQGMLSREMNGVVCFDETDQWIGRRGANRSVQLKNFPEYGTRVKRKGRQLVITHTVPISPVDYWGEMDRCNEITDALDYCVRYIERRVK